MKSLLELYGQQFRNTIPDADSQDYTTSDVFGQMATNKRRAEYDNSLLGIVHNWATGEQRQPVQLPDDASWLDQAKEAGARFLNLPNDMAAGGAKTMAHWLGAAGSPEMVEPLDMLAPLGIGAMAGLGGVVPRGAVGSAGGKLAAAMPATSVERADMLAKNRVELGLSLLNADGKAGAIRDQRKALEMHPLAGYEGTSPTVRGGTPDGRVIVEGGTVTGNNELLGPSDTTRSSLPGLAANALDMSPEARMQRAREMGFSDFTGYSDALAKTEKLRADRDAAYRALGPAARELNGYGWDYDRALADARYFHEALPTAGSKEKLDMLTAPGVAEAAAVYRAAQRPLRQMDRTLEVSDAVERMIDASFKERPMDQGGRVYHGAPEKFVTYDAEKARALNSSGGTRSGSEDVAFVSTGRGMAENFGNEVMSLDLKPGRYFDPANDYDLANLAPYINGRPSPNDIWDYLLKSEPNKTNWPWLESEPVVSELRRLGYDGVKMSGAIDTERGLKPHEFYGVFSRGKVTHADPEMNGATFFADTTRSSLPGLAANALDMSHEARMQRAREMGFDTDTTWYHGTNAKDFDAFDPGTRGATFFSDQPYLTDYFANPSRSDGTSRVIPAHTKSSKLFDPARDADNHDLASYISENIRRYDVESILDPGKTWTKTPDEVLSELRSSKFGKDMFEPVEHPVVQEWMKRNGYDGFVMDDGSWMASAADKPARILGVFDTKNIRSVNAAFDPAKADSANLLAADQARGSLPGLLASAVDEKPQDNELMRLLQLYGMMP